MSTSMKAYLAAKYMSGPKAEAILARTAPSTGKKKKRKVASSSTTASAMIKDDDIAGWEDIPQEPEDEVEEGEGDNCETKSQWRDRGVRDC